MAHVREYLSSVNWNTCGWIMDYWLWHTLKYRRLLFFFFFAEATCSGFLFKAFPSQLKVELFLHSHCAITLRLLYSGRKPLDRLGRNTVYFTANYVTVNLKFLWSRAKDYITNILEPLIYYARSHRYWCVNKFESGLLESWSTSAYQDFATDALLRTDDDSHHSSKYIS